jgi:hypothetical protein
MRYYHQKTNHSHTLLAVGLIIVAGFFTYDVLEGKRVGAQADSALVQDSAATSDATEAPLNNEQIALLSRIENLKLEGAILKDPAFLSLQDRGITLVEQEVGKTNPFAPLGGGAVRPTTPRR